MKISAVVLTKNEEKEIEECLSQLLWCDELIVVDDNSSDQTRDMAKKMGAKVFLHNLNEDYAAQRNFALEKASCDFVLFIDSDERVSANLKQEITNKLKINPVDAYYLVRRDIIWGKQINYGENGKIKLIRLAKKNSGKWLRKVHEEWRVNGVIETLENPLIHYSHASLKEFLKKINFYTTIRANELFNSGVKAKAIDVVLYPKVKFLQNYLFKRGFLDGQRGLILATLMSFHSFLVRGKLWQLQNS